MFIPEYTEAEKMSKTLKSIDTTAYFWSFVESGINEAVTVAGLRAENEAYRCLLR